MSIATLTPSADSVDDVAPATFADLLERLGGVPPERIRLQPPPGTATEADALANEHCELIDGVLVEKAMGYPDSRIGQVIASYLEIWLAQSKLGFVIGDGAMTRMQTGNMRIPDVCVTLWTRVGGTEVPGEQISGVVPDIAIEVLSPRNTEREIERKRLEFFDSGTEQVWIVRPRTQTIDVWTSVSQMSVLGIADSLNGAPVLPGFQVQVLEVFEAARRGHIDLNIVRAWMNN
ncbi:MAG: Uma2 family endonuclease [Planctomycetaceae bacterium]|nr:Uma2 family endonuclease [Planctomycetaceae bacterium]